MNKAKIMLLFTGGAVIYGIIHDEITAHICVEYFSIAHPPLFHTSSPALLALCWGIAATIGLGAMLGLILAEVSQSPGLPPCPFSRIARAVVLLLARMGAGALVAGCLGYLLAEKGVLSLPAGLAGDIPAARHARFMAVWFAHSASYLIGIAGAGAFTIRIWRERGKPRVIELLPHTPSGFARMAAVLLIAAAIIWLRITRS